MPSQAFRALAPLAVALALAAPATAQTSDDAAAEPAPPASDAPAAAAPAGAPPGAPRIETVRTEGDWQTACVVEAENGPCLMRQIGRTASGQEVLEVTIRRIQPQQTQQGTVESILSIRVPIGVLLREGVSIQIDSAEPQRGAYVYCVEDGCLLQEPLPNSLVDAMKKGANAKVTFVIPQNGRPTPVDANVSLSGFTASFNGLPPG